jgi:hypothetical protein
MAKKKPKSAGPPEANGEPRPSPAYFLSLSLENVRCFREKQTLDLSDGKGGPARWTILLGNNGTGKTTVLQALAVLTEFALPVPPDTFRPLTHLREPQPRWARDEAKDALLFCEFGCGDLTEQQGSHWAKAPAWARIRNPSGGAIIVHSSEARFETQPERPFCCAYGASRRPGPPTVDDPHLTDPAATLFTTDAALVSAGEWLIRMDYTASKPSSAQKRQQERLRQITDLLLGGLLPEVDDIRFDPGEGPDPRPRVEFHTPYGWVPLGALGHGYQTLLAWTVDLANRMVARYPESPNPLAEPAIVLVDEIDLHLHPTWQRQLIGHLTKHFPATQFIVTAHSPLVVQASGDANLAVLRRDGDQVKIDNDLKAIRGWRIDQIYTSDLFGLPSARPPEYDHAIERRKELLLKDHLTEREKKELKELEAKVMSLPGGETPEQRETLSLIEEALRVLQREQKPAS